MLLRSLGERLRRRVVLLLDCANLHIHASRCRLAKQSRVRLVYVPAKMTPWLQPCDTHVFSAFKQALRRNWQRRKADIAGEEVNAAAVFGSHMPDNTGRHAQVQFKITWGNPKMRSCPLISLGNHKKHNPYLSLMRPTFGCARFLVSCLQMENLTAGLFEVAIPVCEGNLNSWKFRFSSLKLFSHLRNPGMIRPPL